MVYHSVGGSWTISQKKSLQFYYNTDFLIQDSPAKRLGLSLRPVGPTILVEWEE